jgi:outer membrane cobalamin receptor
VKYSFGFLLFFLFILPGIRSNAQKLSDTLNLKEIEIRSANSSSTGGFKKVRLDSVLLTPQIHADLSTILSQYSTVFIKSYGNGSLATSSLRGTTSDHTQVEWNGISINSPMLGQMDLSQVPVSQLDNIEVLYGATAISRTSGAFGGVINLVSGPDWRNRIGVSAAQSIGSFSTYVTNLEFQGGSSRVQSKTKLNCNTSLNDFPYTYDVNQGLTTRQKNGSYTLWGLSQEVFIRAGKNDILTLRGWYCDNFRNLPPIATNTDTAFLEHQKDRSFRGLAEWKHVRKDYTLTFRSAYVDQFMNYVSKIIDATHYSHSLVNRALFTYSGVRNLDIRAGIDYTYDWVRSDDYNGLKTRNTLSFYSEALYHPHKKINLSLALREEMVDDKFSNPIAALGTEYKPFNRIDLAFSANLSSNYRFPSLNDLYWNPGGNPTLKPESDYSAEGGVLYKFKNLGGTFFVEAQVNGYYNRMNDLIVWKPSSDSSSYWTPMNVSEVHARGIEAMLNASYTFSGFAINFTNNYAFCRSTSEGQSAIQDSTQGKQLLYIPEHLLNSTLSVTKLGFLLSYNLYYTSARYTSTTNDTQMPGYYLSNIILGKSIFLKKFVISLHLQINNLFDLDYQSIANRPMPGRNYMVTLKFDFKK